MLNRRVILAAAVIAPVASAVLAHPHEELKQEQFADIERQINALRVSIKDAVTSKDVAKLKAIYGGNFTHTHGSGKVDGRDSRIVSLLAGEPVIETAPASELSIRIYGPDMAIVAGKSPILNTKEGVTYEFRWMQVYTRASGDWQLVASQATRLPLTS